jgi:hypothetical protein
MKTRIEQLIVEVKSEMRKENSYPYLPEILNSLETMRGALSLSRERRSKMAGALGRIVTEDYSFSESHLGDKIIKLANDFSELYLN